MTVEAGCTLRQAQAAAEAAGLLLPLSISSEGSAQIGGVLATNAGGNNTLRFGNARDLVLGLEVVLADGAVWDGLRHLHKDNTGYALRAAVRRLRGHAGHHHRSRPPPAAGRRRPGRGLLRPAVGGRGPLAAGASAPPGARRAPCLRIYERPVDRAGAAAHRGHGADRWPWPATTSSSISRPAATRRPWRRRWRRTLGEALEAEEILDAALSRSEAQRLAFWRLREEHSEAQKRAGASIKNDVSVPVSKVPALLREAAIVCEALEPGIPRRSLRPPRRREHPPQPDPARRRRPGGVSRPLRCADACE